MPTNKFHYIWMGRLPAGKYEESFKNGPNALAQQLKDYVMDVRKEREKDAPNPQDQEIIMWVPEALIAGIKEAGYLDPDITLKPVEDLYKNAKHLSPEERANLETTVNLLGENNAYSAQKDILQAAILEEYGGYYFDTTSEVASVEHLINNQPKSMWFPRITEEDAKFFDGDAVILPDVWAMYNPTPGEGTCKAMLNDYIKRCQFYFPEEFDGVDLDVEGLRVKTGYDIYDGVPDEVSDVSDEVPIASDEGSYGRGKKIMNDPDFRDALIGQLVIFSLYEGVKQKKRSLSNDVMLSLSSYAGNTTDGKHVEDFGITKFHRGTWRKQAIADSVVERAEEREAAVEARVEARVEHAPTPPKERFHAFTVQGGDFENFKTKYQSLKGDLLKHRIIVDFAEKISAITDKDTLDHFVSDFKKSTAYATLAKGQGVTTRLFSLNTDCMKQVDELVKARTAELEAPKLSTS